MWGYIWLSVCLVVSVLYPTSVHIHTSVHLLHGCMLLYISQYVCMAPYICTTPYICISLIHLYTPLYVCMPPYIPHMSVWPHASLHHPIQLYAPHTSVHLAIHLYIPHTSVHSCIFVCPHTSPVCLYALDICKLPHTSVQHLDLYTPICPHTSVCPKYISHMSLYPIHLYNPSYICIPPYIYTLPVHLYALIYLYTHCMPPIHLYAPSTSPLCHYTLYMCTPHTSIHVSDKIVFCSRGCCQYQIFAFITIQVQITDCM